MTELHIVTPTVGQSPTPDAYEAVCAALAKSREQAATYANEVGSLTAENARVRQERDEAKAELEHRRAEVAELRAALQGPVPSDPQSEEQGASYVALVAALRAEFAAPAALEALRIQLTEHRDNRSSLGTLARAITDAGDVSYDAGEMAHPAVRAWLKRNLPKAEATR